LVRPSTLSGENALVLVPCGRALVLVASLLAGLAAADPGVTARAAEGSGFRLVLPTGLFR